jgi:hypothetical protein
MDKAEVYSIWAPADAVWSPWVKPVVFAWAESAPPAQPGMLGIAQDDLTYLPRATDRSIVIVDLPGALSLLCGLELAKRGFRPVPLYNGIPGPTPESQASLDLGEDEVAVDVRPIISLIWHNSAWLKNINLPIDAPPTFLLDSKRSPIFIARNTKVFDNRWLLFPEDVPSAEFLHEQTLRRVIIIQAGRRVRSDLRKVLLNWQDQRLALYLLRLPAHGPAVSYMVKGLSDLDEIILIWLQNGLFGDPKHGFGKSRFLAG